MRVNSLYIYPIKSCRGISLSRAEVTPKGFRHDREMMLVDASGKFLTQRQHPKMATIGVTLAGESIALSAGDREISFQPTFTGEKIPVEVWGDRAIAIDQGDEVARWFEEVLEIPCRLVRQSPDEIRPVNPSYAGDSSTPVSFADGYPILLTNTASLADLNDRLTEKIPMIRFRPNLVIESERPFIESGWKSIEIAGILYSLVKPCSRCLITTTDQQTGERNPTKEPLKTLATYRTFAGGIMFGENVIPRKTGMIAVGDPVTILE
ncbi:MOSC domain-containing protein [Pannus brasiliensis CCIBt3594]|uniref:MOSC domain-containing protein n=1 Tax=Pannus brasiliensis CCIBt3594 TaxID=1427578 RepID=A0AAW9QHS3_9CHRO